VVCLHWALQVSEYLPEVSPVFADETKAQEAVSNWVVAARSAGSYKTEETRNISHAGPPSSQCWVR
jgi:hypothetical protein